MVYLSSLFPSTVNQESRFMLKRPITEEVYKKLCNVIPGGVNSPVRACKGVKQTPMVIERAFEDMVYDVDGHAYVDLCCSWGAIIHGHAKPTILSAVQKRAAMGTTFGITSSIEEKLASKITGLMPSIEKIRFVSSGTEATMSAARLARGYTSRDLIVKFNGNFHGHADFFLVQAGSGVLGLNNTSSSKGIPDDIVKFTVSLPYNDEKICKDYLLKPENRNRVAAVILEPIAGNIGVVPASKSFLQMLRKITKEIGALLIFDEVITGFRVGLNGVQGMHGITPDITCLAKIIGGGFPAAAFGGKREIMDMLAPLGPVYQAGTLSGNPVAMEAGLQTLTLLEKPGFYEALELKTRLLTDPIQEYITKNNLKACVQRVGSMFTLFFGRTAVNDMNDVQELDNELFGKYFRYMFENGVYVSPLQCEACFITSAHKEANLFKARDLILNFLKENCEALQSESEALAAARS